MFCQCGVVRYGSPDPRFGADTELTIAIFLILVEGVVVGLCAVQISADYGITFADYLG